MQQKILKGSKTEANLLAAFAGESQARNKYTFFGAKAKEDGFQQIGDLFLETANNEKEHAEIWFKILHNGMQPTTDNLQAAADGEQYEYETMYPTFAKEAREEGFDRIATLFELVAKIEQEHMQRFQHLSSQLLYHMLHRDLFIFSRHIHIADKEILFLFPLDLQQFHIFVTPVHAFTDINPGNRIQKLKSALDRPFQQCSGKFAGTACQIIRCNLCRTHIRSP